MGDRAAMEQLLVEAQPRLMAVCFRMTRDPEEARDLCQDAMVKIIQGLAGFSGRSRLSTWMTRVAMNVCLTHHRRQRIRATVSLQSTGSTTENPRPLGARLEDHAEPPVQQRVQRGEEFERLSSAFARLDPEHRALLILRDGQGLEYAEISESLSIPVGTVKSRIFRARVALREQIESLGRERGAVAPQNLRGAR